MFTRPMQNRISVAMGGRAREIGKAAIVASAVAALSLTAVPVSAHAGGVGPGAAIGLGVLGGVLAGAAIASSTPPVYGAPPAAYYYPPQSWPGYYYYSTPAYYPAQQYYYYGWRPYR